MALADALDEIGACGSMSFMPIVYDEPKRAANLDQHGLDMADFEDGFDFTERWISKQVLSGS